ncbi:MAG: hypothetical protein DHS20C16_27020 [Phycisphaerae bacterium]|nr:MAG: hypothetical protein DHS20C16_27020 [Phycisphaerae bacterium]
MWWEYIIVVGGLLLAVIYAIVFARRVFSEGDGCGCGHGACSNDGHNESQSQKLKVTPLVELKGPADPK